MRFLSLLLLPVVLPAFAIDENFIHHRDEVFFKDVCERLLEGDLSGLYVITTTVEKNLRHTRLVQLRRMGLSSSYSVNTARLILPSAGLRELTAQRLPEGWQIGDPHTPEGRVNVLSLHVEPMRVVFHFEDVADPTGMFYEAAVANRENAIRGDILNPEGLTLDFHSGVTATYQMSRVRFDRAFERVVSQSLKSLLADRFDSEDSGIGDYVITAEMKAPMTLDEASQILGTNRVYPMEVSKADTFYRFAVLIGVPEFLGSALQLTHNRNINHLDAVSGRLLDPKLLKVINDHVNLRNTLLRASPPEPVLIPEVRPHEPRDLDEEGAG